MYDQPDYARILKFIGSRGLNDEDEEEDDDETTSAPGSTGYEFEPSLDAGQDMSRDKQKEVPVTNPESNGVRIFGADEVDFEFSHCDLSALLALPKTFCE